MVDNTQPIIEVKGLKFTYPSEDESPPPALDGIDLLVHPGEYIAVIGSNGSGKTTLLKHFNALLKPTAGEVLINGLCAAVEENLPAIRRFCGMIFQNPDNQLVATTVEEDVAFGLENQALPPAEIRLRVAQALETLGLAHRGQHPPHLLSGGEKQRVAVAGVLAMQPRCLLLDEPTAMLDPAGQAEVLEAVRRLNREFNISVIHVTHFPEEAAQARRILVMDRGKIVKDGASAEVLTDLAALHSLGLRGTTGSELAALLEEDGFSLARKPVHDWELVDLLCSSKQKT